MFDNRTFSQRMTDEARANEIGRAVAKGRSSRGGGGGGGGGGCGLLILFIVVPAIIGFVRNPGKAVDSFLNCFHHVTPEPEVVLPEWSWQPIPDPPNSYSENWVVKEHIRDSLTSHRVYISLFEATHAEVGFEADGWTPEVSYPVGWRYHLEYQPEEYLISSEPTHDPRCLSSMVVRFKLKTQDCSVRRVRVRLFEYVKEFPLRNTCWHSSPTSWPDVKTYFRLPEFRQQISLPMNKDGLTDCFWVPNWFKPTWVCVRPDTFWRLSCFNATEQDAAMKEESPSSDGVGRFVRFRQNPDKAMLANVLVQLDALPEAGLTRPFVGR